MLLAVISVVMSEPFVMPVLVDLKTCGMMGYATYISVVDVLCYVLWLLISGLRFAFLCDVNLMQDKPNDWVSHSFSHFGVILNG